MLQTFRSPSSGPFFKFSSSFPVLVYEKVYMDDKVIRGITTKTRTIVKNECVLGDNLLCSVLVPTIQKRHEQTLDRVQRKATEMFKGLENPAYAGR